jgi:uncharacterized protein (TIRG00374 family)
LHGGKSGVILHAMNEQDMEKKKKTRKRIGTALFILLNVAVIAVTAGIEFGSERAISRNDLLDMKPWYLTAVAGCFLCALAAETAKYYLLMRESAGKGTLQQAFQVAALGKYYDFITPLSAGGQPFQVIYLSRIGLDAGSAGAVPVAGYLYRHAAFVIISVITLLCGGAGVRSAALLIPACIGLLCIILVPAAIILFAVAPALTERVVHWCLTLLQKLKLLRDVEDREAVVLRALGSYTQSLKLLGRDKRMFFWAVVCSTVFECALAFMPYFVLRAFGNTIGFWSVFRSCVLIYLSVTFIPTPGNSGAAEGSFYALFAVLGQGHLFWAMLVWRFFCYYAFLVVGLLVQARIATRGYQPAEGK